jgi:uncharacterized protein (DUF302 family)
MNEKRNRSALCKVFRVKHTATLVEKNIGLMLPCNVNIYEKASKTVLSLIRLTVAMQMIENVEFQKLAGAVDEQPKKALDAIK